MTSYRPFRFTGLAQYSKEQIAVQQSMALCLSYRILQPNFMRALSHLLSEHLKTACSVGVPQLKRLARADLWALLPDMACLFVLGLSPGNAKILVEIDTRFAHVAIDMLLGGNGKISQPARPLSEIECGILSYLMLHVLELLSTSWQRGYEMCLTLDRCVTNVAALQNVIDTENGYQQLNTSLGFGLQTHAIRVFIPDSLITTRFGALDTNSLNHTMTAETLDLMRAALRVVGEQEVWGRVVASKMMLQREDIRHVEVGDIIVLENHKLQKTLHGIAGEAVLRVGAGRYGGFVGRLKYNSDDQQQTWFEIVSIVTDEQPTEVSMSSYDDHDEDNDNNNDNYNDHNDHNYQDNAEHDNLAHEDTQQIEKTTHHFDMPAAEDNLQETAGLLRDVDIAMSIELGRIRLNAAQLVRLRAGQILRLMRGPHDPVDLVVDGKLFARGELIEVDHELGIRLTQVAGVD